MYEKILLFNFERHFSLAESSFSYQDVLGEEPWKNTSRRRSLQNKNRSPAGEVKITNLCDLEVAYPPMKITRTERSIMLNEIKRESAARLLHGIFLQQRSKTSEGNSYEAPDGL